jgi:hypothetical protein
MTMPAAVSEKTAPCRNLLLATLLVLAVIALKWPVLEMPYYWDEAGAYFNPARWLAGRSLLDLLPGRHPAEMFFGHPPLLYLLVACLFKLFGHTPPISHLVIAIFAAQGLFYTYRLGELLFGSGVGIGAALLLMAWPLYFAQSGMLLGDIPVTALVCGTVYYYLRRCSLGYLLFGAAAVLVKEHAALLLLMLLLFDRFVTTEQSRLFRGKLFQWLPLVILGVFFGVQKLATGAFLPNPFFNNNPLIHTSAASLAFKIAFANYWAFFAQGRFLLTLVIAVTIWRKRETLPRVLVLFALIIFSYVAAYSFIYFIPRYILIVTPFLCLMGSASLHYLVPDRLHYAAGIAVLALVSMFFPDLKHRGNDNFETSMQYLEVISVQQQAAAFLERSYPGALVSAPWPLSASLAEPAYGYLHHPLRMTGIDGPWTLLLATPQADKVQSEAIERIVRKGGLEQVAHFERAGKMVDVFRRAVPDSGLESML